MKVSQAKNLKVLCAAVIFLLITAIKLLFPEQTEPARQALHELISRDVDYISVFRDVGQALSSDGAVTEAVNAEIQERVDAKIAEGEQLIAEYKEAYFATGGTEEEWAQHDNKVTVTYEIKSQTDETVSFVVESAVSFANAYQEETYYNLNLADDRELTLQDVLGEDWVEKCNESIREQMDAAEDPSVYFTPDAGGFTTVDEDTQFYLNEAGNPVVVFPPYTVAVGAMGTVEFEITK